MLADSTRGLQQEISKLTEAIEALTKKLVGRKNKKRVYPTADEDDVFGSYEITKKGLLAS